MSFFGGNTKLSNRTPVPAAVGRAAAVARLHDHAFFLRCDPHYSSHKTLDADDAGQNDKGKGKGFGLPAAVEQTLGGGVCVYEVVDHLPNPVWSSNVVSREEFANFADGLWVRIRSPMGVVMETTWTIKEKDGGGGGLELVEDIDIACSRLLLGIVRGQVENNWRGIHERLIAKMVEDVEGGGKKKGEGEE
ncbi:hypothetical protein GGR56DRAFT_620825 [Xylariaceae sp. FL0804]|nr:hypothetical protein GGR56DRAFT_620825 [Xylariaceae sp. FL0804]